VETVGLLCLIFLPHPSEINFSLFIRLYIGGHCKWKMLQDTDLTKFNLFFGKSPEVIGSFMEAEAKQVMEGTIFWLFGKDPKENS
jgi:hypothetical protein